METMIKVIPKKDFNWKYDRMYAFIYNQACEVPEGLYKQAKHMFDLPESIAKPKKEKKVEEVLNETE